MEQEKSYGNEIDLKGLFFALKKKLWILIAAFVAGAFMMGVYTEIYITPQYRATSMLYVLTTSSGVSLADLQLGSQLQSDYAILMKTRPVMNQVIENLDLDMSAGELAGKISFENPADTRIMKITVTDTIPERAQKIANEMASVTAKQLAHVMQTQEPSVAEEAVLPGGPISPNLKRNCMKGGLFGLVLAAGIITVLYLLNDKLRTEEDIEKYLQLTTLGVIPDEGQKKHKGTHKK